MARRKLIYTYLEGDKHYIIDRKEFVRILAEEVYYDTTTYDWFGIDSANYEEGERKTKWLARSGIILCVGKRNFRVFKQEQWERHPKEWKEKYIDKRKAK